MLNGFEEITAELNTKELSLVPSFVSELSQHVGAAKAITNDKLAAKIHATNPGTKIIKGPRVRKIINFIRLTGKVQLLCATSKGYYVARTPKELNEYMEGLKDRIDAQRHVYNCLAYQFNEKRRESAKKA